jgi:hypothetical protein
MSKFVKVITWTSFAPMFWNLSLRSMAFATVTPSLVILGLPQLCSMITFRPLKKTRTVLKLNQQTLKKAIKTISYLHNFRVVVTSWMFCSDRDNKFIIKCTLLSNVQNLFYSSVLYLDNLCGENTESTNTSAKFLQLN